DDERPAVAGIGLDQPGPQAEPLPELEPPWLVGDERIRAALARESVEAIRRDHTAGPILRFQPHQLAPPPRRPGPFAQPDRGGQAREAPTDHDHAFQFRRVARPLGQGCSLPYRCATLGFAMRRSTREKIPGGGKRAVLARNRSWRHTARCRRIILEAPASG